MRAESSVARLKAELQQLQVGCWVEVGSVPPARISVNFPPCWFQAEISSLRSENNRLKTAESEVVMTMRCNAKMASEHLNTMADRARCSLRSASVK